MGVRLQRGFQLATLLTACAAAAGVLAARAAFRDEAPAAPPVLAAADFVAGIGVNTHLGWRNSAYVDRRRVLAAADYIGVRRFRDVLEPSSFEAIDTAAGAGATFALVAGPHLEAYLADAHRLARDHPGAVAALEGPNEVDGWPVSFDGLRGYAGSAAYQRALYAQAKRDPLLAAAPVYNLSVSGVAAGKYRALGDLSAHADYANVHIYYGGGQPWYGWSRRDRRFAWSNWLEAGRIDAPGRPVVVTETGATTAAGGVSEKVQAKQLLNALMDAARSGVAAAYIYELVDSRLDPSGRNPEAHFGIFRADWSPKPAADALHNLTRILGEPPEPRHAAASPPAYAITGLPEDGGRLLLRKSDGTCALVLWAEPDIWDETRKTDIPAKVTPVTVTLAKAASVSIYDPMVGSSPVASMGPAQRFEVDVVDHPLIVELRFAPAPKGQMTRRGNQFAAPP